jgi:hypothetical protein
MQTNMQTFICTTLQEVVMHKQSERKQAMGVLGKQTDVLGKQNDVLGKQTDALGKQNDALGKTKDVMGKHTDPHLS